MTQEAMVKVFNEWERRYREDPNAFMAAESVREQSLDDARPQSYGATATRCFLNIAKDLGL